MMAPAPVLATHTLPTTPSERRPAGCRAAMARSSARSGASSAASSPSRASKSGSAASPTWNRAATDATSAATKMAKGNSARKNR